MTHTLIAPELLQRLAGSLLHFLWQGASIALAAALGLRLLARRSAESRYAVAVAGLLLMTAAPLVTFVFYADTGRAADRLLGLLNQTLAEAGRSANGQDTAVWTGWIVFAWFAGVAVCLLRLVAAWCVSRQLVRSAESAVPLVLGRMFARIAKELAIPRRAQILVSARIPIPAVIGWLRPVVLFPVHALTHLDEDQLRAVLVHELAHIRRHDFLVNTLQRCVESWLFYHPAVWWLSARIRSERELCCDDMVIRICNDRVAYAEGLLQLERARIASAALTVAATGGPLTRRIHRILGRETANRDLQTAVVAAAVVLIWIVGGFWQVLTLEAKTISTRSAASTIGAIRADAPAEPVESAIPRKVPDSIDNYGRGFGGVLNSIAAIVTAQPVRSELQQTSTTPQTGAEGHRGLGVIRGIVTRQGTNDPIPDVQIRVDSLAQRPIDDLSIGAPRNVADLQEAQRVLNETKTPFVRDPRGAVMFLIGGNIYSFREEENSQQGQVLLDLASRSTVAPEVLQVLRAMAGRDPKTGEVLPEPAQLTTVSDSEGRFTIKDVPVGLATVWAWRQGYFSPQGGTQNTVAHTNVLDEKASDVQLSLMPGGTITGRVLDSNGKPAADASVQVLRVAYADGVPTFRTMIQKTADDRGEYRLYPLTPGDYYVAAAPSPEGPPRGAGVKETAVRTLYPSAIDIASATPISLHAGDEHSAIDIRLRKVSAVSIAGTVVSTLPAVPPLVANSNTCGVPAGTTRLPAATVRITPHDSNAISGAPGNQFQADSGGRFVIPNLLPGGYDLFATIPTSHGWGVGNPPQFADCGVAIGRTTIDVRGADVDNASITVRSGGDLKGRILVDGKPTSAAVSITLESIDSSAGLSGTLGQLFQQVGRFQPAIEQDATFSIPIVPEGRYRIRVALGTAPALQKEQARGNGGAILTRVAQTGLSALPADAYVIDIRQGDGSVYDNGITIGATDPAPIDVMIGTNPGSIAGTVTGADQKPAPDATVVLVPAENRRQNPVLYKTARSDAQGKFTMTKLPPGEYKLFAWDSVQPNAYQNADFMKNVEARGAAVTITGGLRASAEVGLIRSDAAGQ